MRVAKNLRKGMIYNNFNVRKRERFIKILKSGQNYNYGVPVDDTAAFDAVAGWSDR